MTKKNIKKLKTTWEILISMIIKMIIVAKKNINQSKTT